MDQSFSISITIRTHFYRSKLPTNDTTKQCYCGRQNGRQAQ